jgi:hypothetical protein
VAAGDVNGDGVDEVLVAAPYADGVDKSRLACGEAYVIWLGDSDGDSLPDIGDPCPTEADCDDDQFDDYIELYLDTDPLDNCPDNPSDDAWPLDIDMNGDLSATGDVFYYRGRIGATQGDPEWWQRLDLDMSGDISVTGDVFMYRGMIGESCT